MRCGMARGCCIEAYDSVISANHCIIKGTGNTVCGNANVIVGHNNTLRYGIDNYLMGHNYVEEVAKATNRALETPAPHRLVHETAYRKNYMKIWSVEDALHFLGYSAIMEMLQYGFDITAFGTDGLPPGPDLSVMRSQQHQATNSTSTNTNVVMLVELNPSRQSSECESSYCATALPWISGLQSFNLVLGSVENLSRNPSKCTREFEELFPTEHAQTIPSSILDQGDFFLPLFSRPVPLQRTFLSRFNEMFDPSFSGPSFTQHSTFPSALHAFFPDPALANTRNLMGVVVQRRYRRDTTIVGDLDGVNRNNKDENEDEDEDKNNEEVKTNPTQPVRNCHAVPSFDVLLRTPTPRDPKGVVPLMKDHIAEDGDISCKICLVHKACIMTRTCNHMAMCRTCAANLYASSSDILCPFCREPVTEFHAVFL